MHPLRRMSGREFMLEWLFLLRCPLLGVSAVSSWFFLPWTNAFFLFLVLCFSFMKDFLVYKLSDSHNGTQV